MKRNIATIKQNDYTSKEEFEKDIEKMKEKGYILICNGMYSGVLEPQEINDGIWKYTAHFIKSNLI